MNPIATCLTGEIRTLVYPIVQDNFKNIMNRLHFDLFMVVSRKVTTKWYSNKTNPLSHTSYAQVEFIKKILNPKVLKIYEDHELNVTSIPKEYFHRYLNQRKQLCFKEVLNYESKYKLNYNIFISARPDLFYTCIPPVVNGLTHWSILNQDFFAMVTRDNAATIFGIPDVDIKTCNKNSPKYTLFREEWCEACMLWEQQSHVYSMNLRPFLSNTTCNLKSLSQKKCFKPIEIKRPEPLPNASHFKYGSWNMKRDESIILHFRDELCSISPACTNSLIWNPPCRNFHNRNPCARIKNNP